jgi:hypothetical protein
MYPPAISYEVYKIERGLTLTGADQRAADKRAGEMAAALGHQWRALVRLLTLAAARDAWRRWNTPRRGVARPIPLHPVPPVPPGGANALRILGGMAAPQGPRSGPVRQHVGPAEGRPMLSPFPLIRRASSEWN